MAVHSLDALPEEVALRRQGFGNDHSVLDLLEVVTHDADNRIFLTIDGAMWRAYRLGLFARDTLGKDDYLAISEGAASVLNELDERASLQFIRYTHNDIMPTLRAFEAEVRDDDLAPANPFARDILQSIVERQARAADKGFFDKLTPRAIQSAKDTLLDEAESSQRKEDLSERVDTEISHGKYAIMVEVFLTVRHEPEWMRKKGSMGQGIFKALKSGIGIRDAEKEMQQVYRAEVRKFQLALQRLVQSLQSYHFAPSVVSGQGIIESLFRELNPSRMQRRADAGEDSAAPRYRRDLTLREQVLQRSMSNKQQSANARLRGDIGRHALFTDVRPSPKGLTVEGVHYRTVSLLESPEIVYPGCLQDIIDTYEGPGWAVINVTRKSHTAAWGATQVKAQLVGMKETMMNLGPMKWLAGDTKMLEAAREDVSTMVEAVNSDSTEYQAILDFSLHITLKGRDEQELEERAHSLAVALWRKGYLESHRADAIQHSCLPFNFRPKQQSLLARSFPMRATDAAEFLPVYSANTGTPKCTKVLVNNDQGMPIFMDLFGPDTVAGHTLILGGTGSGKSFGAQLILQQMYAKERIKTWLIDKGGSFREFFYAFGGQYLDLSLDDDGSDVSLNPFYLPLGLNEKTGQYDIIGVPAAEDIAFMLGVLRSMAQTADAKVEVSLDKQDMSVFQAALKQLFENRRIALQAILDQEGVDALHAALPDHEILLSGHIQPLLRSDEFGEKFGRERCARLANMLADYSLGDGGPYGAMFDRPLTVDWEGDLMGIETDAVAKSPMFPTLMMVLFHNINLYAKWRLPKNMKKILAMDEAWAALSDPGIAGLFAGYVYEMRKFNAALIMISQGLSQLQALFKAEQQSGSGMTGGMLDNLKHFIFLACSPTDYELGKSLLAMTDEEVDAWSRVSSLPPYYSNAIYRRRTKRDVALTGRIRLNATPIQLWLSTTDPDDLTIRAKLKERYVSEGCPPVEATAKAVKELAEQYPYGSKFVLEEEA